MSTVTPTSEIWGPLAEPVHPDEAGPADPVWKDNAYLSFWDVPARVFGTLHLSTSPNGEGSRRARCSVSADGQVAEVVEELPVGEFRSESIHFGLDGRIKVSHPDLDVDLVNLPLFTPADYAVGGVIPELVPGRPLRHYQQAAAVEGTIRLRGRQHDVAGHGMRDRTWGFRDESAQWVEYAGLIGVFEGTFITAMKFLGNDGSLRADGFLVDDQGQRTITGMWFTRDAAAQFVSARLKLGDGSTFGVTMTGREGGFWVPMGARNEGPSFGTYDDFLRLELAGRSGAGFFEQGIVHRVW
ncbi:hypothetical protein HFP15_14970 [Amycolatopsis sp. K13G38]|uniref:AttH domain-containing protein n=1 Tax=Amycolatopsis acididurans TaxID=2724524 RepID=A0ABX1J344_9PSEU|nr:hypothetical protein [Amycolatopsis acididurans]NKQ54188.1 hypothetical protein [Amycolatopsis acididurans]